MPALISSLAVNVFDHSQRHGAVLSRRESVRPRQIRFFLSEETPPALSGPAHSFSCNPDTRDETLRHLAAFSQATVFCPHSLPDTPHFSFGGMTTTALLGSAHPLSRNPGACNKRSGTLRHFLRQPFFARTLYLTRRIFFRRHDNDRPPWFGAFAFPQPRRPRRNAPAPCGIFSSNRFLLALFT